MNNQKKWDSIKDTIDSDVKKVVDILTQAIEKDISPKIVFEGLPLFYSKEVIDKALEVLWISTKAMSEPFDTYKDEKKVNIY